MNDIADVLMNGGMITSICIPNILITIICTILMPPIGIWINQHNKGYNNVSTIVISFILTAAFYFPGLIYSLFIIINSNK